MKKKKNTCKDKFGTCIKCLLIYKAKIVYSDWAKFDNYVCFLTDNAVKISAVDQPTEQPSQYTDQPGGSVH